MGKSPMCIEDEVEALLLSLSREEAQLAAASLWLALMYAKPTSSPPREWLKWLARCLGRRA